MFNALKYIKGLEGAGVPRKHAEAHAEYFMASLESEIATKRDLQDLKLELKSEMSHMENRIMIRLGTLMITCMTLQTGILGFFISIKMK
jgi:hypothetical protein